MIAIPTVDGWVHAALMKSIIPQMGNRPLCIMGGIVPVEAARNAIADQFMSSDCTHLFMVDADTIPPGDIIDRLLKLDTDVATSITPIAKGDDVTSNIFKAEAGEGFPLSWEEATKETTPFSITAVGFACILIKRSVFERLEAPYFVSQWFKNGKFCDGEIEFCNKLREKGMKIVCDPTLICGHVKQVTL